jgi:superfamily II DNA/RNA helicase
MIIASETGSGKTLVFLIGVFMNAFPSDFAACQRDKSRTGIRALVVVPTGIRQLVAQHQSTFERVAHHLHNTKDCFWEGARLDRDGSVRYGVSSTTWRSTKKHAQGGQQQPDNPDDRKDDFSRALIRIDTADRILKSCQEHSRKYPGPSLLAGVKVIAIDEVDKVYNDPSKQDAPNVEELVVHCPSAQIICASATIVRHFEEKEDHTTHWLKGSRFRTMCAPGQYREFISIQSENVMPKSVFHLVVNLGALSSELQERAQLAWEQLHCLKGQESLLPGEDRYPGPCLCFWNDGKSMTEHHQRICSSFRDKSSVESKPAILSLDRDKSILSKALELGRLGSGQFTGCIGNKTFATGLDHPFRSTIISQMTPKYRYTWDDYTHLSGRCGRKPSELGTSVTFIHNKVRFLSFLR